MNLDRDFVLNVQPCKITKKKKKVGFQAFLEKQELVLKPQVKNVQDPMGGIRILLYIGKCFLDIRAHSIITV